MIGSTAANISFNVERGSYLLFRRIPDPQRRRDAYADHQFTGVLNDKMAGFYRSKYTNTQGESRYMAVTQFEATDARRCFPCWDEPSLKAPSVSP